MSDQQTLEHRIRRLEDREEIRELVARYGIVIDDRVIDGIADCFTLDGAFRSRDGMLNARGRDAVVEQFRSRFAVLGPSNHFTHDHIIRFDERHPDRATGLVTSHAEVVRHSQAMWTALRYEDEYHREDGRWRFADRLLSFMYYVRVEEYAAAMAGTERMRAYAQPTAADYPEKLESWQRYYGG